MFACKRCIRLKRGLEADGGYVRNEIADPIFTRLVEYMGSKAAVCTALGKDKAYLSRNKGQYRFKIVEEARILLAQLEKERKVGKYGHQGDAEVVDGEILSRYLKKWVEDWQKEYPQGFDGARRRHKKQTIEELAENVYFMGPLQYLHEQSKPQVHIRKISGMVNNEYPIVGIRHADAVLTAANLNFLLMEIDGKPAEIPIFPNPNWPMEKWLQYMFYESMG